MRWQAPHRTSLCQFDTLEFASTLRCGVKAPKGSSAPPGTAPKSHCRHYPFVRKASPTCNYPANILLPRQSDQASSPRVFRPYQQETDQSFAIDRKRLCLSPHIADISWHSDLCSAEACSPTFRKSACSGHLPRNRAAYCGPARCMNVSKTAHVRDQSLIGLSRMRSRKKGMSVRFLEGL